MFFYHIFFLECLTEHVRSIFTQTFFAVRAITDCCRCANRAKHTFRHIQLQLQTTNQISNISTLCTIVCMQFIQNNKTQCLSFCIDVASPESTESLAHQSVVKHLKVSQKDIWNRIKNGITILYDMVFTHVTRIILGICTLSDKQSGCHLAFQTLVFPNGFGKTFCLVTGKGIHRIHDDNFHANLSLILVAVIAIVEYRIKETLSLTRTCSRSKQRWLWLVSILHGQLAERLQLMLIWRKAWCDIQRNILAFFLCC